MSPPGETVQELLQRSNVEASDVLRHANLTSNQLRKLFSGSLAIDAILAKRLGELFGASEEYWLNREAQYRADIRHIQISETSDEAKSWLAQLPVADMAKFGWVLQGRTVAERTHNALDFFGVESIQAWKFRYQRSLAVAAFRSTSAFETNPASVTAWLRQAQRLADEQACEPWNPDKLRSKLLTIRKLTRQKSPSKFLPFLTKVFSDCGVAFVVVRSPKGCRASGATQFLDAQTAMLAVSFRYLADDQFWFTLFHEIGHLLLHGQDVLFLEDGSDVTEVEETEANNFAANALIPERLNSLLYEVRLQSKSIIRLAGRLGVSPGVLVGQMQNRGILPPHRLNSLKRRYNWEEISRFSSVSL